MNNANDRPAFGDVVSFMESLMTRDCPYIDVTNTEDLENIMAPLADSEG